MKIKKFIKDRPLSWSAISSFEYDPEQWYQNYYLGIKTPPTPEMIFGKKFADSCEAGKPLAPVTLLSKMEQGFKVVFGDIPLIGFADTFDHIGKKKIGEYKTGIKAWDQKRVDEHGQITMYALMNYISSRIKPEDTKFFLEWIPTKKMGDYSIEFAHNPPQVIHFKTKRTMKDILEFGARINSTVQKMEDYINKRENILS